MAIFVQNTLVTFGDALSFKIKTNEKNKIKILKNEESGSRFLQIVNEFQDKSPKMCPKIHFT